MSTPSLAAAVSFTEEMLGHVTFAETSYDRGAVPTRAGAVPLKFHLTVEIADVRAFERDPRRRASGRGYVVCEALGGRLPVEQGAINLLVNAGPRTKRMEYRLWFRDGVGHALTLTGFKLVHDDPGFDIWRDTTTLFTRILRGFVPPDADAGAEVVASGTLRIRVRDFARQLTTLRTRGATPGAQAAALLRFGWLFTGDLAQIYMRGSAAPLGPRAEQA
jgi:hypothetical protein